MRGGHEAGERKAWRVTEVEAGERRRKAGERKLEVEGVWELRSWGPGVSSWALNRSLTGVITSTASTISASS